MRLTSPDVDELSVHGCLVNRISGAIHLATDPDVLGSNLGGLQCFLTAVVASFLK